MSNVWLIDGDLIGRRKYKGCIISFRYKLERCGFDSRWCLWIFHWHNLSSRTIFLGFIRSL